MTFPAQLTKRQAQIMRAVADDNVRWNTISNGIIFVVAIDVPGKRPSVREMNLLRQNGLIVGGPCRPSLIKSGTYTITDEGRAALEQTDALKDVHLLDEGTMVTAYIGPKITNGDEILNQTTGSEIYVIGHASRVFGHAGGGWWGWYVNLGTDNYPLQEATKQIAISYLLAEVASYQRRRSGSV